MLFSKSSGQLRREILQKTTQLNVLKGSVSDFNLSSVIEELKAGNKITQPRTAFAHTIAEASKVTNDVGKDWLRFIQHIFYVNQSATITYELLNIGTDEEIVEATINH